MKGMCTFAALVLAAVLAGCASTQDSSVSAGAVGESGCCKSKTSCTAGGTAAPGAVSEGGGCCKSKGSCTKTEGAAPGAVSGSSCTKVCPATGQTASPGAVSGAKSGCCSKGG